MTTDNPARGDGQQAKSLERKVDDLAASVDRRFNEVDRRFDAVDRRFEGIDRRFEEVDKRFDEVAQALIEQRQYTEFAFDRLRDEMRGGFDRLERKLDRFIDTQMTTNELVDRRLRLLERHSQA